MAVTLSELEMEGELEMEEEGEGELEEELEGELEQEGIFGNLASMANGLPYTIAAQIAHPERQCVGFVGDGGFSMLMAEFATAVKYHLPIKIVIIKNGTLGQIKWEQMVFLGNPEYGVELQPIDFAAFARAFGGTGFSVDDPADYLDTFMKRARREAQPKDAKGQKDEAAN